MGAFLKFLPKLIPFLPQLIEGVFKVIGVFRKKHDPKEVALAAAEEVKKLQAHASEQEEAEWKIVKGDK